MEEIATIVEATFTFSDPASSLPSHDSSSSPSSKRLTKFS